MMEAIVRYYLTANLTATALNIGEQLPTLWTIWCRVYYSLDIGEHC
jgi:hypothetical protein